MAHVGGFSSVNARLVAVVAGLLSMSCVTVQMPSAPAPPGRESTPAPATAATARRSPAEIAATGTVLVESPAGHGSGAYLGGDRVLTAAHVVSGRGPFTVSFNDRRIGQAVVLAFDAYDDLALLSAPGLGSAGASAFAWGSADSLRLGEAITVVGFPGPVGLTATQGIFSGLKRRGGTDYVQTDAAVNPGNSGGPLVNGTGELVGIAVFQIRDSQGLNFAVASSTAQRFVDAGVSSNTYPAQDPVATAPAVMTTFYSYLQDRLYYSAWSMLSEDWRIRQPYSDYVGGFSQTISTRFQVASTRPLTATSARVAGNVIATESSPNNPPGFVTQSVYSGSYDVAYIGGRWMILSGTLDLANRGFVRR